MCYYVIFEKFIQLCNHHHNHDIEYFHHPKIFFLCLFPVKSLPPYLIP